MSLDSFNHKKDEEMRESYETTLKDNKNNAVAFLKNIKWTQLPEKTDLKIGQNS